MLDKIYKALVILGIIIGLGVAFERLTATTALAASLEVRLAAVEKQTAENTLNGKVTAELLAKTADMLRANDIEDAKWHHLLGKESR